MDYNPPRTYVKYIVIALKAFFLSLTAYFIYIEHRLLYRFCFYSVPFVACPICPQPCPFSKYHQPVLTAMLLSSLPAGRIFCGTACPFGTLQDIIHFPVSKLSEKTKRRLKNIFSGFTPFLKIADTALRLVKYPVLLLACLYILSLFGQRHGFLPDWAFLPSIQFTMAVGRVAGVRSIHFLLVFILFSVITALFVHRPWCKYLCPYGLPAGFFNKIALFRMKFDLKKCIVRKNPMTNCTTRLPLVRLKDAFHSPECIRCLNCIANCPKKSLTF